MSHDKRIIVDFDDTISLTTTRDWENATPIWPTINKINSLYDKGWEIWIVTARGQISCNGDFQKADKKYRKIIENWLEKHGVKYHELKFEKYLASYYIDDKALTPEAFVDLDIREIKTGWSGAKVEKRGNRIYKTHHDSISAAKWYKMAEPIVNVPIVYSVIDKTICLEYLKSNGHNFKIDDINNDIEKFSLYKNLPDNKFEKYIHRMKNHCEDNNNFYDILNLITDDKVVKECNNKISFMHGDLSLENVIQTDKGMFLIDPIYKEDQWSSYLLDISKMLHSFRKYNRMFEYEVFLNTWIKKGESAYLLELLELTQWIRVIKYIPDLKLKEEYIQKTKNLMNNLKKKYNHV